MSSQTAPGLPTFVKEVTGELEATYWRPQNQREWTTSIQWRSWEGQQTQLRQLRGTIAIWIFILITVQVLAVFGIVILDACDVFKANADITKYLIPSVMAEVFGMGFLVVKYLFRANKGDEKMPPKGG